MQYDDEAVPLRWTRMPDARAAAALAPDGPGVYAAGAIARAHGLPLTSEWSCVVASPSLRDDLLALDEEALPALQRRRAAERELWYVTTPTYADAQKLARSLARRLSDPDGAAAPIVIRRAAPASPFEEGAVR